MVRRKKKKQPLKINYLLIFIVLVCLVYEPIRQTVYEKHREEQSSTQHTSEKQDTKKEATPFHAANGTKLEIPAKLKHATEQILYRKGYTVSYNKELKIPNWVAWELTPEKLVERESRTDKFLPDPDLPEDEAVTTDDYKGAGMDRGHMCPAGDNR